MGDSRREREAKVQRTFQPLYRLAGDILQDSVDAIKGEPVLIAWGQYMSAAHTLTGFGSCFARIAPQADLSIFDKLAAKLHHGAPVTKAEADALIIALRKCEAIYRCTPLKDLRAAILTEQIAIELDALNERRAA